MPMPQSLINLGIIPYVVAVFVILLTLAFIIWYWFPSWRLRKTLDPIIKDLKALKPSTGSGPVDCDRVKKLLDVDPKLQHLWDEYAKTLHKQYDYGDGERRLKAIRATVPAEAFFNTQVLVDTPLNTEFFRHLPGLLTGIGIIGTFFGLIQGLSGFEPTGSAETVKASLGALMGGVQEAFIASAVAIFFAMLITFMEKSSLNRRYKEVEQLTQAIDALYEAGAGEEYLARLANAAEESATQTKQLKQSLVDDLKQILTDLTEMQIQASQQNSQQMATSVGVAIESSLQTPLQQIADMVERASGQQGTAVQSMLENLLATFITKIETTFGGQMHGLSNMMTTSVEAMREMQGEFGKLVTDLRQAGQSGTEEMGKKLGEMMEQADTRQKLVEEQVVTLVKAFEDQRNEAAKAEQQHLENLAGKAKTFVDGLSGETAKLSTQVMSTVHAMDTSVDKMNVGAQKMLEAATEFKDAGMAVTGVMKQGVSTMTDLRNASTQISSASKELAEIMRNTQNSQQTMLGMVSSLQVLVDQAKREAGVSKQIVDDMNKVANTLRLVEQQSQQYLNEVNKVITASFEHFGGAVKTSLETSTGAFQSELDKGVKILKAAFDELSVVVSQFPRNP